MQRRILIAIISIAVIIFGSVVWLTEQAHLTGLPLFVLCIGAFILTTVLITLLQLWQLSHATKKQEPHDHE
ncbi:hypothetical protein [Furfurilactobacillus siliginis]|uniref:Uncharacterized protein n=1 Tax=Furfurilactobacillus siliginis TaxID=348151 RepID=A0A0R2L724_9LACO|nr:hypothetical protein [Furfurilactobacillus siliginis]KRN94685.1 hypothetical protein IV55_GL000453 [Furfurilactobacillus siliginis]GEK28397.1 hypothetical protein LSI01_07080 [Furfurilactobacillus siliginis]